MAKLHATLLSRTADHRERLQALPFFQALRAGTVPKPALASYRRCLSILQAVLERELSQTSNPGIAALGQRLPSRLSRSSAGLEVSIPSVAPAIRNALAYGAEILTGAGDPLGLIGPLYVLDGLQAAEAETGTALAEGLDALALDGAGEDRVLRSAVLCLERMETICGALFPYAAADLRHHAAAVNFEAGDHAIPQDVGEIALALRAGKAAWEAYPYLERRFGERGRRFTSSDSCWLVALTRMPIETATKNLDWLRTVLASRGIPTVILEGHLRAIVQQLALEFPEQVDMRGRYDRFLAGLEAGRQALGWTGETSLLVAQLGQRLQACEGQTVASAAELIASAWIDERCGIAGSLASVHGWFTDTERFSPAWVALVGELVASLDGTCVPAC